MAKSFNFSSLVLNSSILFGGQSYSSPEAWVLSLGEGIAYFSKDFPESKEYFLISKAPTGSSTKHIAY